MHTGDRVVATELEDHANIAFSVRIEESDKYEPHLFSVTFDEAPPGTAGPEQARTTPLAGAAWRCRIDRGETACVDLTSGAELVPPEWLLFFHAEWMPQRTGRSPD